MKNDLPRTVKVNFDLLEQSVEFLHRLHSSFPFHIEQPLNEENLDAVLSHFESIVITLKAQNERNRIAAELEVQLAQQFGYTDHPAKYVFTLKRDALAHEEDNIYELYLMSKVDWIRFAAWDWDSGSFIEWDQVLQQFGEVQDSDGGLYWIKGDMEKARTALIAVGVQEEPTLIDKMREYPDDEQERIYLDDQEYD